jgi:hypothetical protein
MHMLSNWPMVVFFIISSSSTGMVVEAIVHGQSELFVLVVEEDK